MNKHWAAAMTPVIAAGLLASCTSGTNAAHDSTTPPTPPTTSAVSSMSVIPSSSSGLSRAAFVAKANQMCTAEEAQLKKVVPATFSVANIPTFVDQTTAVLEQARQQFTTLVAAQPDAATLQTNWLTPRFADYTAQEKALATLKADVQRQNLSAAQSDLQAIAKLPSHDATVKPYLMSYGLTACA